MTGPINYSFDPIGHHHWSWKPLGPAKEGQQVSIDVEGRELASPKVGFLDTVLRYRVEHVTQPELLKKLVDTLDADTAARSSRDE